MPHGLPRYLSEAEMALVTEQQAAQQAAWRNVDPEGTVATCQGRACRSKSPAKWP